MYFEQFDLGCLAHASYSLASEGEAVVVDPQGDVEIYLKAAEKSALHSQHLRNPTSCRLRFWTPKLASSSGARINIAAQSKQPSLT